ncbi:enoyl-CoA hydratase, probable [Pyrobaculum aerophilum str. IM2]|uniref:Enoyl-CoA hydratase, probable n=1 Tax=Pyrobaculum aerophilum (strain ATCC 51768 / DSM 7523 / JCM 9630 / CIP 104966 / NBRC 100827 / IM2) TaxID=178306 RepID=Q8ZWR9_PYRAE|nr:enoyl-CoA hydratase, probable [Pyrobaculum aerophilum str. IM2]
MYLLVRIVIRIEPFGKYDKVVLTGEKRNAITRDVLESLLKLGCEREVIVTNEGPVFSAGLDLSVFLESKERVLEYLFTIHKLIKKFLDCDKRIIAYIKGDVYGLGVELLYFFDYVVAASEALKFSLQGINFGLFPPYTVSIGKYLFSYGHLRIMLSRDFTAGEAFRFGIVSEIGQLSPERLFSPPEHIGAFVKAKRWIMERVDEAVPYLYKLAEAATSEETRSRIKKFFAGNRGKS